MKSFVFSVVAKQEVRSDYATFTKCARSTILSLFVMCLAIYGASNSNFKRMKFSAPEIRHLGMG